MPEPVTHHERLWPPALWWLVAALLAGTVWLVLVVSTPAVVTVAGTAGTAACCLVALLAGAVRVGVRGGEVVAGRAHVPVRWCGAVEPLSAAEARRARGVDADARAFLLLRAYVSTAVRVVLDDPADPTPYWLVSTRRPEQFAAAAQAAGAATRAADGPADPAAGAGVRHDEPRTRRGRPAGTDR